MFVTRVLCDKNVAQCLSCITAKFNEEIRRGPSIGGSNWDEVHGFRSIREAISRKRCDIELRWQLITNRKSHDGLLIATKVADPELP